MENRTEGSIKLRVMYGERNTVIELRISNYELRVKNGGRPIEMRFLIFPAGWRISNLPAFGVASFQHL